MTCCHNNRVLLPHREQLKEEQQQLPKWVEGDQQTGGTEGDLQDSDAEGQQGGVEGEQEGGAEGQQDSVHEENLGQHL